MSEKNEIKRVLRIAVLVFGLEVLLAGGVLLLYVFREKPEGRIKQATVTRIWDDNEYRRTEYRFKYDTSGRLIRQKTQETRNGKKKEEEILEIHYYAGGCGIGKSERTSYNNRLYFDNPILGGDSAESYEASQDRLTEVKSRENNYGINTYMFDSQGRPSRLVHADANADSRYTGVFQYDDQGRVIRITSTYENGNEYVTEVVYEGKKITACTSRPDKSKYREREYDGSRLIRYTDYDTKGEVYWEVKYYYPNGNFSLGGVINAYEEEQLFVCKSVWKGFSQSWGAEVELAPDGQPLRVVDENGESMENIYGENGMLCERVQKDAEGNILADYLFEFDRSGNVIRISSKDGQEDYRFTWE